MLGHSEGTTFIHIAEGGPHAFQPKEKKEKKWPFLLRAQLRSLAYVLHIFTSLWPGQMTDSVARKAEKFSQ